MATITVNTFTDELDGSIFDGDVSLRDALAVVSDGDRIEFDSGLFFADQNGLNNSTITLTLGELSISNDITIDGDVNGDGITDVSISGGGTSRIFNIDSSTADVHLHALHLENASSISSGGAVRVHNANSVTVSNSLFTDNAATGWGGGLYSATSGVTIVNSYFANNTATTSGGAIGLLQGGTIVNSTITQNEAGGLGGAIRSSGSGLEVTNTTITGNYGSSVGGISGDVTISNSIVFANRDSGGYDDISGTIISNGANIFGSGTTGTAAGDQVLSILNLPNVFQDVGPVTVGGVTFDAGLVTSTTGITPLIGITHGGLAHDAGITADVPSESDLGFDVDNSGTTGSGPLTIDGRGLNRVEGGSVDIGAAESNGGIWIVDTTDDVYDGNLTTGNLSLREAIKLANDGDTITFDSSIFTADGDERSNTIISWTGDREFIGSGRTITINGDTNGDGIADVTVDGTGGDPQQFMYVAPGSGLNFESLTFQNFYSASASGGILASNGTVSVLNSTFTNNEASGFAGAIRNYTSGVMTIANSTFDGNSADSGGAIRNTGDLTIFNSTFHGNLAADTVGSDGGGAIENTSSGDLVITNSTFTGNTAELNGGAILHEGTGNLVLNNSIFVGNSAVGDLQDVTIASGASAGTSTGGNVFGTTQLSAAGDVIGATTATVFDESASISVGTVVHNAGVMGSNGGTTDTVLILLGGVAQNQGVSAQIPTEATLGLDLDTDGNLSANVADTTDQTGNARENGTSVDAGAVELNAGLIIVTTTEDTRDGDTSLDDISWREAIDLVSDGGTITFDETLFTVDGNALSNTTINVAAAGETIASKNFSIDGDLNDDGIADVTFDGLLSGDEWAFFQTGGISITLDGLNFRNFNDPSVSGGVMRAYSDLHIRNSIFQDNTAGNLGGALRLYSGSHLIENSLFYGNTADGAGGAIRSTNSDTTILNSTFTGNTTNNDGGAIQVGSGTLRLINSTVTGNYSAIDGGGVDRFSGTLSIFNSIIAGNADAGGLSDVTGTFSSNGHNLFGVGQTGTAAGDVVLATEGDLANVFNVTGSVTLGGATFVAGQVADNGGTMPTVALNAQNMGNPALDAGDNTALDESVVGVDLNGDGDTVDLISSDGRGLGRFRELPGIGGAGNTDIGAFEVQRSATVGPDHMVGNVSDNTLSALAGSDYLRGRGGNDTLLGGSGDDLLEGGTGDDLIDGGTNSGAGDTALFSGNRAGYGFATDQLGRTLVIDTNLADGDDGTDTLTAVEHLQFADGTVAIADAPDNGFAETGRTTLTDAATTISLSRTYDNPVVVAFVMTENGVQPVNVRVSNVTSTDLTLQIQEPNHLDGGHFGEEVGYLVVEAGSWILPDGTLLEAGTLTSNQLSSSGFETVEFDTEFDATPVILSQVQTKGGADFVTTRQRAADADGFEITMQEEEALNGGAHGIETLGWVAIQEGSGSIGPFEWAAGQTSGVTDGNTAVALPFTAHGVVAGVSSTAGIDPGWARGAGIPSNVFNVSVEEDTSLDRETAHVPETVDFFAFSESQLLVSAPTQTIIETGTIALSSTETVISLSHSFDNPVVAAFVATETGSQEVNVRITNVDGDILSMQLQEPNHLDGAHLAEIVSYMVVEAGSWVLPDGTLLEAGTLNSNKLSSQGFETVTFNAAFDAAPVVLSHVQTKTGVDFVTTRQRPADATGFEITMQEEEALNGGSHTMETLGWIAIEAGHGALSGFNWEAGSFSGVGDGGVTVPFTSGQPMGNVVAGMSSYAGGNSSWVRGNGTTLNAFNVSIEEDRSLDPETVHNGETVDYFAFSETGTALGYDYDFFA